MSDIFIHGASAFTDAANEDTNQLKKKLSRCTPDNFRRVNRFILLTLLGARQCIHEHSLDPDTAVYLTTEHGNLGETAQVLDEIYLAHSLPKPFGFINTMSNTAAFYLAQSLGIRGRNIIVSSQHLSFERGMELVRTDFAGGVEKNALIGGVDEAALSQMFMEGQGGRGWQMVDGSGWLYVKTEKDGAVGTIKEIRSFRDSASCMMWVRERAPVDVVSFGALIDDYEAAKLRRVLQPAAEFDYLSEYGYSGSSTACGVSLFIRLFTGKTLLHINKDWRGHYAVIEVKRY
ncbi:MAG TPA: beta-ketoacyl synthase N-terminal-like domain-containing protein [Syntrophales bacterium]|nr:beta-ketoacyl synthase N-terminal-like domain-containing protein [Syntrophales bacterium]